MNNSGANLPFIPETITVHLGPPDSGAENVTVPFADYIKNVASSEIYPTWSENAIRANVLAEISFALNRIYTEYYRSRGYDFDITNSTAIDQSYVKSRDIFDNVSEIVDEIFNDYIVRQGAVEPLFALYCDGIEVQCEGLSQWGSEQLGREGATPYEILTNYYGDNINIVNDAPIQGPTESYPGVPLRRGSSGNEVAFIQTRLNRIAENYPAIPKITPETAFFGQSTEEAVKAFQRIFFLTEDGVVGRATWYKIQQIYSAVKSLSDLASEGIPIEDVTNVLTPRLAVGSSGAGVFELQYLLSFISDFIDTIPRVDRDGVFGSETENALKAFQTYYGLEPTGVVELPTWEKLLSAYRGMLASLPEGSLDERDTYVGSPLTQGDSGILVERIQTYLNFISDFTPSIPKVTVDGEYGPATARAVSAFQSTAGLEPTGTVGSATYYALVTRYRELAEG